MAKRRENKYRHLLRALKKEKRYAFNLINDPEFWMREHLNLRVMTDVSKEANRRLLMGDPSGKGYPAPQGFFRSIQDKAGLYE